MALGFREMMLTVLTGKINFKTNYVALQVLGEKGVYAGTDS